MTPALVDSDADLIIKSAVSELNQKPQVEVFNLAQPTSALSV